MIFGRNLYCGEKVCIIMYPSDISFRALKIKIVFFNTYAARLTQNIFKCLHEVSPTISLVLVKYCSESKLGDCI